MLEREFQYYLDHQSELVNTYNNKYIVIKNEKILGAYSSSSEAYHATIKNEEPGTFLIQHCTPGKDSYTQHFFSRVAF